MESLLLKRVTYTPKTGNKASTELVMKVDSRDNTNFVVQTRGEDNTLRTFNYFGDYPTARDWFMNHLPPEFQVAFNGDINSDGVRFDKPEYL